MATVVALPRLSDTMVEGVIAKWRVAKGDKVKRGQVIAEIETDKATMEFESFDTGTVLELVAPEGETLPIGAPIAVLGKEGEDAAAALQQAGKGGAAAPAPASSGGNGHAAKAPVAEPQPEPAAAKAAPAQPQAVAPAPKRDDGRVPASPLARRLAREHDLDIAAIPGSGPHGRVVKTDVERAAQSGARAPAATTTVGERPFVTRPDQPQKLSQMRKAIARRMSQANTEIPHFYLTIAVDMARAVALRAELVESMPEAKISFNDIVVMACSRALARHPEINAFWDGETIVRRGDIHVGIAVAVDEGLVVPVVRFADQKALHDIAVEARDLGTRAREKKLDPSAMQGSTFTVSNLGMFGVSEFMAVVNPGEGAILAVGAITDQPVIEGGEIVPGKRMSVTLSCDHRVMDGAMAARFLATVRELLEHPLKMLA